MVVKRDNNLIGVMPVFVFEGKTYMVVWSDKKDFVIK